MVPIEVVVVVVVVDRGKTILPKVFCFDEYSFNPYCERLDQKIPFISSRLNFDSSRFGSFRMVFDDDDDDDDDDDLIVVEPDKTIGGLFFPLVKN